MLTEQSNDREVFYFPFLLCSLSQVHDYFCMNVAASVNSKQKQMESECTQPTNKLKRTILELTRKRHSITAYGSFRTIQGPGRIGNHLLFFHNPTVTHHLTILSLSYRLRKGRLFVSPLKRRKCIRGRRSPG